MNSTPKSGSLYPKTSRKFTRGIESKMQGGRGRGRGVGVPGMNPFFGLGNLFSGFGRPANLMSEFFRGANPFNGLFFSSSPFGDGNLFGDLFFARPMIGESMFGGSGFFGPMGSPFMNAVPSGFIGQHQESPEPRPSQSQGPIIEEIDSDEEEEDKDDGGEIRENLESIAGRQKLDWHYSYCS